MDSEQRENLDRVSERIGAAVINFCRQHVGKHFFADELREAVIRDTGLAAPASADRILRYMRQKKRIAYSVVSRHLSLYKVTSIENHNEEN